jgi:tRNA(His) 5'-end guanylyltransferase
MSNVRDPLGDRIKRYEDRETSRRAMKGLPLVIRVDGRSFSRFTKGMARPYDIDFAKLMVEVTKYLVDELHGICGYTQSDEISIIVDPFLSKKDDILLSFGGFGETEFLFDGRLQKLVSVSAGLATARFMQDAIRLWPDRCRKHLPVFDSRVFEVPNREEASWAIAWRLADCEKNAVTMAARAHFSHKELHGKSGRDMIQMLADKGEDFFALPASFRRGTFVLRRLVEKELPPETLALIPVGNRPTGPVLRRETVAIDMPPVRAIKNFVDVLMSGAKPVMKTARIEDNLSEDAV